jgi:hypothetical protein
MRPHRYAEEKVPGGKLARVTIRQDAASDHRDFFAHPGMTLVNARRAGRDGAAEEAET